MQTWKTAGDFPRTAAKDEAPSAIYGSDGGFLVPPQFVGRLSEEGFNTYRGRWKRLRALWAVLRGRTVLYRSEFGDDQLRPPAGAVAIGCRYVGTAMRMPKGN